MMRPTQTASAIGAAFRAAKAGARMRLAKNVVRGGDRAGIRVAQCTRKMAENSKDVARAARLAEAKGGQTRAILSTMGRGTMLLAGVLFAMTLWIFVALL